MDLIYHIPASQIRGANPGSGLAIQQNISYLCG